MTTFFGSSGRYDITALAADKNATEMFLLYQASSESSRDYAGLPVLPSGCITLVSVTVVRTQNKVVIDIITRSGSRQGHAGLLYIRETSPPFVRTGDQLFYPSYCGRI
jgi:hypothetical protein